MTDDILEALAPVAKKYGLTVAKAAGSYTTYEWDAKVTFTFAEAKRKRDIQELNRYNIPIDTWFTQGRTRYKVTGWDENSKYPVEVITSDGKTARFTVGAVQEILRSF